MKNTNKLFMYSLIIVFFLSGCSVKAEQSVTPTPTPIVIGYCPTMRPIIQSLIQNHNNLEVVQFDNSGMAIQSLKSGLVHAILIGRIARENEINQDFQHILLKDGYTLITKKQSAILYENLAQIKIFTSEEVTQAQEMLPMDTSITRSQNLEKTFLEMDETSAILLRWSEVPPAAYQLLIPIDTQGNKIPDFRSPNFYYHSDFQDDLSPIIDELASH